MSKSQSKGPMKGLNQFIVDLRNSKDQEEEYKKITHEISNIRSKFQSSTTLNGYQKKKYVCKLIYVYILGNSDLVDFGLRESKELLMSNIFSEKKLGYLAVSILLNNEKISKKTLFTPKEYLNHILGEIHEHLISDLQSKNEEVNCLAIQMIATCFTATSVEVYDSDSNSGKWVELIDMVYASLTSPLQKPIVKQKAAIALKSLLQLYPEVLLKNENWTPRLVKIIEESTNLGLVTASIPLLGLIVTLNPLVMKLIMPSIAHRLFALVVKDECPAEYYYYDTPAPWLIVKLLQFVESAFVAVDKDKNSILSIDQMDANTVSELRQVVSKSIQNASQHVKGLPNRNSQSSILFQAVSLAVFLEASTDAINGASNALLVLITSNDTNTRYLALDALIKLTGRSKSSYLSSKDKFDEHLPLFMRLLNDKDVSIRRKALDLLYTICNTENYTTLVNHLLDYYQHADIQLKGELSIKIAVLAETFATDSTWYVTTMLKLLSIGGGGSGLSTSNEAGIIDREIWERIVQIVVNNDDIQKKACKIIINLLKRPFANDQTHPHPPISENMIKIAAFILGEFGDKVDDADDLRVSIQFDLLFKAYFGVSLSTRAMLLTTFLKLLVKFPDSDFVPEIIDLFEAETQSLDLEIQTRAYEYLKLSTLHSDFRLAKSVVKGIPAFDQEESPLMSRLGVVGSHLHRLTRSKSAVLARNIKSKPENIANGNENEQNHTFSKILSKHWYSGYQRMLHFDAGIFYDDQFMKITYRIVRNNAELTMKFTIINNAHKTVGENITGLSLDVESLTNQSNPNYVVQVKQLPESTVSDKTQMEMNVLVRDVIKKDESPIMSLTFMCGSSFNQLNLKFTVSLLKTVTPTPLKGIDVFDRRWQQIGQHLGVVDGESTVSVQLAHRQDQAALNRTLFRLGFGVIPDVSGTGTGSEIESAVYACGAGIIHTQKSNHGVLVKLLILDEIGKDVRIVVRCTGKGVAEVVSSTLKEIFVGKT